MRAVGLVIAFILCNLCSMAQTDGAYSWPDKGVWPESPKAATIREVTSPLPALLTGAAEFTVPLYSLEAEGMTLPFEFRYHSNAPADSTDADFSTEYAYDILSRPTSIKRRGVVDIDGSTEIFGQLDNLTISYDGPFPSSVQSEITDDTGRSFYGRTGWANGTYMTKAALRFNTAGRLKEDVGRTILSLSYNTLGLPLCYTMGNDNAAPHMERAYDATGSKLRQTVIDYVRGVKTKMSDRRYLESFTFNADTLERIDFNGGYFDGHGEAHFLLPDWQGNVTITTDARGRVEQHIGYYPYGEPWREPSGQRATLYAAKERTDGIAAGEYDFGPRGYQAPLLLWGSPDNNSPDYPWWSPWLYCGGNPIRHTDPTGNDIVLFGQNDSQLVIATSLLDEHFNLSSWGIDWGGEYILHGDNIVSAALDIVGIFDPTGAADVLNASLQAKNGNWWDAGISLAGVIPYVGDVAKVGKIDKDVKIFETAIDACKQGQKTTKAVHGNAKESTKAQHLYEIFDIDTGKAVKTGISGSKITKAGKSYRATNQVNKWNRESGYYRFDSRIIKEFPAGPNARLRALEAEKRNANRLRNQRELDSRYHKRP